jgi:hypothetical protein
MLYGCFLSYYDDYFESALDEFLLILISNSGGYNCIVVDNGNLSHTQHQLAESKGCTVIIGDNRLGEFSGWQKALDYIKLNYESSLDNSDNFFFANDTFNQHRKWSFKNRLGAIAGLMESKKTPSVPTLVGHVERTDKLYSISKLPCNAWVSTFLFIANFSFINKLQWQISLSDPELKDYYSAVSETGVDWGLSVSEPLKAHLNQWLFPDNSKVHSWYGASIKTAVQKKFKLAAILNEKYLSAKCINKNGRLVSWRKNSEYILLIVKNYKSIFMAVKNSVYRVN